MRSGPFTPSAVRRANATVVVRDNRLQFVQASLTEGVSITFYDAETNGTNILRIANVGDELYADDFTPGGAPSWADTGIDLYAGSRPGLFGTRLFYQAPDGHLYFSDWNGSTFPSGTLFYEPITADTAWALAPVSTTVVYGQHQIVSGDYVQGSLVQVTTAGAFNRWFGRIYADALSFNIFDAIRFNGEDYIYFTDDASKRTLYIKKINAVWGEAQPVVPMDVLDDLSIFEAGHATEIDGKVFLSGRLRRGDGPVMHVYTIGPEHYTMGRDLFIGPAGGGQGGKLHFITDTLYYVMDQRIFTAPATQLVGYDNPARKKTITNIAGISTQHASSSFTSLSLDLKTDVGDIQPGTDVFVEVDISGQKQQIGVFDTDVPQYGRGPTGESRVLQGRGRAIKRMEQWESDAFYDYWSQTKQDSDPVELTEMIRVGGQSWSDDGSGELQFDGLNVDGVLYCSSRASRNASIRARFNPQTGTYSSDWGVGVNFYRESKYDAAKRLDKEIADVEETEYGINGVFAIYGPTRHLGTSGIALYRMANGVLDYQWSIALTLTLDQYIWMQMNYNDGEIDILTRPESNTNWTHHLQWSYQDDVYKPWARIIYSEDEDPKVDPAGRGAIYIKNTSPNSECFFFSSTSNIIPIQDNGDFPTSETVIVDREEINYSGKSTNGLYGPLNVIEAGGIVDSFETIGAGNRNFGDGPNPNVVAARISGTFSLKGAAVHVRKVGSPRDLTVAVYKPPQTPSQPLGQFVTQGFIPAADITGTYAWHEVAFPASVAVSGEFWLEMYQKNPSVESPTDYFETPRTAGGSSHSWRFNDDTDQWTPMDGDIPYRVLGTGGSQPGGSFPIFVDNGPNEADNFSNGMAFAVTQGAGENYLGRIVGYKYDPAGSVIWVDTDPRTLDNTSKGFICPVLVVAARGVNDTIATSHDGSLVSVKVTPQISVSRVQFHSSETDKSLEWMARELAAKAGVLEVSARQEREETINFTGGFSFPGIYTATRRNFIMELSSDWAAEAGVFGYWDGANGHAVTIDTQYVRRYDLGGGAVLKERVPLNHATSGKVLFSFFDHHLSVWNAGRLVHAFTVPEADRKEGTTAGILGGGTVTVDVMWPQADMRIDNFAADMGRRGTMLLNQLIGENRVFFHDGENGNLVLVKDRVQLPGTYDYDVQGSTFKSDARMMTRVRIEGAEVFEKIDLDLIREYGNIFRSLNMNSVISRYDAEREADASLEDAGSNIVSATVTGAMDFRLEPNDLLDVTNWGLLIVDSVGYFVRVSDVGVFADMVVEGRWPRSEI